MTRILAKAVKKFTLPSKFLVGSSSLYMDTLNHKHSDFHFNKTGNIISVAIDGRKKHMRNRHKDPGEWAALNRTTSAKEAEQGLIFATNTLRLISKFMINILPTIFKKNKIPMEEFTRAGVQLNMEGTAYQITRRYPS